MNWYLAKFVFRIFCGDGQHMAQFDEQLRLIAAGSKEEAFHKAQSMGMKEEDMFCPNCGFPQRGGQEKMKSFIWNIKNSRKQNYVIFPCRHANLQYISIRFRTVYGYIIFI